MNTKLQNRKVQSLRSRFLLTITLLTIVRLGSFIPVPYIDREIFASLLETKTSSTSAIAKAINTFSGSGNNSFSVLSLGILPYINASIVLQLLISLIPSLSKFQKEEGEYGQRKITDFLRYLTFICAILDSISVTYSFRELIFNWCFWTITQISITLVNGSMIVLWFSELITRYGLGNGSSLLICFNIISSLPEQIKLFAFSLKNQPKALMEIFFLFGIFLTTTTGCIYINEAIIRIPLVSANQLRKKNTLEFKAKNFNSILPLRLNQSGVMPLVFTSYAMVILSSIISLIRNQLKKVFFFNLLNQFRLLLFYFRLNLSDWILCWIEKLFFWSIYAALIFFFTYFYSTIVLNPKDVTEQFSKSSVVILGISPGNPTRSYLKKTLRRIARINANFLIIYIIGLQVIESLINVASLPGLGLTSQLILVSILIDTIKRIKSFLNGA